jgi:predicted dehydrogenase
MIKKFRIGIVGAGLIGNKRAAAAQKIGGSIIVAVADTDVKRGEEFAQKYKCEFVPRWEDLVKIKDIDVVIVAVPNVFIFPVVMSALKGGKHVLCEKPFGINAREARLMMEAGKKYKKLIKVGFSNRFHPGIFKAKQLVDEGAIGKVLFIRSRHGHGGRVGMEKEWRMNKKISGGGELLDQGPHIADLCRWFGGEYETAYGAVDTKFWKTDVDDNAFVILRGRTVTAAFHVSTTNWGNIFSLEVFGDRGAITIEGLGRHYGEETLRVGVRREPFNDLEAEIFTYPREVDESWDEEWKNFIGALHKKNKMIGDARDGFEANKIIDALYASSKSGKAVKLSHI